MNIDRKARICFNIIVKYFITERMLMGKPNLSYKLKIQSFTVISNIIRYAFLVSFSFILLYPFLYIVVNSFKGISDFFDPTVEWMPKHLYFGNFSKTIKIQNIHFSKIYSLKKRTEVQIISLFKKNILIFCTKSKIPDSPSMLYY